MTAKFTSGPWTCKRSGDGKRYIIGENQSAWGTDVGEVYSDDTDHDEAAANAALIQHAPELFSALDALVADVTNPAALKRACEALALAAKEGNQ